ncbi:bifunctional sugar-1-phosphate nucleotidylyltransferase/acetyltransferase [Halorhabdus rudnickae]|uniref:bifunctional sugar-1-phosphate nucleotidylyltransferase/acetyltransferase n=1 Tax=Halorhabdus rudnickae TaxID=1775544 RepID=UPI001082D93A|nr:bifunctional sugar-1-phosphate nucleotidylyltransferase/acetyltransferase [Halorhabdus rudnickae]
MQAVVLAAGQGTRMAPLTDNTPKPMLPVAGRPLAAHVADAAVDAGADELVFVVGYEADDVRSYFGGSYRGVSVTYAVQSEQAGTADALRAASDELEGAFAVLNGDNLYDSAEIERLFADGPALGTYEVPDPSNYGVVSINDGSIAEIVEKPDDPPTDQINAGAYVFPSKAREWVAVSESERGEYEITDILARVIDDYDVTPVAFDRWMDVGHPWELLEANELLLEGIDRDVSGTVSDAADLRGTVVVEDGATIEPGVVIEGPVYVAAGAEIGPNAYLRGSTYLGEDVHVGNGVEIKNSVIRAGSAVPHLSYVGDSVVGLDVNFGAGTKVANLRHDEADVRVTVKGERVSTGRRKMGVVTGDDIKTGINTSIEPGVVLSSGTRIEPGERVSRDR